MPFERTFSFFFRRNIEDVLSLWGQEQDCLPILLMLDKNTGMVQVQINVKLFLCVSLSYTLIFPFPTMTCMSMKYIWWPWKWNFKMYPFAFNKNNYKPTIPIHLIRSLNVHFCNLIQYLSHCISKYTK